MEGQGSGQEGLQAMGAWGLHRQWERAGPWALWTDRLCRSQESAGATLYTALCRTLSILPMSTCKKVTWDCSGETSHGSRPIKILWDVRYKCNTVAGLGMYIKKTDQVWWIKNMLHTDRTLLLWTDSQLKWQNSGNLQERVINRPHHIPTGYTVSEIRLYIWTSQAHVL